MQRTALLWSFCSRVIYILTSQLVVLTCLRKGKKREKDGYLEIKGRKKEEKHISNCLFDSSNN